MRKHGRISPESDWEMMKSLKSIIPVKGGFYGSLIVLVLPIAFQNLMTAAVSAADVVMVGVVSQTALSAVSLASQVQFVLSLFYAGLTIGTTILAAQYWGKGDKSVVEQVLGISIKLSLVISVLFAVGAIFFTGQLMMIFTSDPELIATGIPYLRIVGISYLFTSVSQIYLCIMKNTGKALLSTIISSTAMILNIILNAVFVFGLFGAPKSGVAGVAAATTISRAIELIWCIAVSAKEDNVRIRIKYIIKNNWELFKDFMHYSTPVLGNELVWGCGFTMYSVIMGHLGSDAVAANSIANIVKNLAISLCIGVSSGGAILLGIELGKKDLKLAKLYAARLCKLSLVTGVIGGGIILAARPFILDFASLSQLARGYLSTMLYICSYYVIGKSINSTIIAGIFCAGGDTKFGFICDTIDMWLFAVPLGLLCAFIFNLPVGWVYFIISLDELVKLPFVYRHYKKYLWLKNLTREFEQSDSA